MSNVIRLVGVLIVVGFCTTWSPAQPTTAPAEEKESTVTRVYDISDLIWRKNNYPAPAATDSENGSDGATTTDSGDNGRQEIVDSICKLLQDTVMPDSWRDNGGMLGSLRELSGQLVVTQSAQNHQKVQEILQSLRADRGRMVVVRAYWVLLSPEEVPTTTAQANGKSLPIADDKLIDAKHLYCGGQTMCFNGQTVHVTSGRTRSIVTGLSPVVGTNAVGYEPHLERPRSGVSLQLTPHLEPEGRDSRCVVDLHSEVTELNNINGEKIELPPSSQPVAGTESLDRVNTVNQQMSTTVRLPLGDKVLVGGMTLEPAAKEEASRQLYLVIQADAVK